MAKTLMGVVYDTRTLAVRRIIYPDDDAALKNGTHHLLPGEAMTLHQTLNGRDVKAAINAVRLATGREPPTLEKVRDQRL